MLQLSNAYKEAILALGKNPSTFPVTEGKWGNSTIKFNDSFANLKYTEMIFSVVFSDSSESSVTIGSSTGSDLGNLTPGATDTFISSIAAAALSSLGPEASAEVLSALSAQLEAETSGSSDALIVPVETSLGVTDSQSDLSLEPTENLVAVTSLLDNALVVASQGGDLGVDSSEGSSLEVGNFSPSQLSVTLSYGTVDTSANTIEIMLNNLQPISSFEFYLTGVILEGIGSGGSSALTGFSVTVEPDTGKVTGTSMTGGAVETGEGALTVLSYSQITAAQTCIVNGTFLDINGEELGITYGSCLDLT